MRMKTFFQVSIAQVKGCGFHQWSKAELLTWLVLEAHADRQGVSYPGYATIERLTGLSPGQISSAIARLEERKAVMVERTARKANRYRLLLKQKYPTTRTVVGSTTKTEVPPTTKAVEEGDPFFEEDPFD